MVFQRERGSFRALACLFAFLGTALPVRALADVPRFDDAQSQRVMGLLNGQSCGARFAQSRAVLLAQAQATASPSPSASPSAPPTPAFLPGAGKPGSPYATPVPQSSPVTPPPIPTPTPAPSASAGPVPLVRTSATPSIAPAQPYGTPAPSPTPLTAPTLQPGYIAVMADKLTGSTKPGVPGDATGNVHIFYQNEVLVGNRAHYDGIRTITVTGDPYIIDNTKDSVLYADKITFDTISQKAELVNGRGESSQGVQQGLVYFSAKDLKSDEHGVSHGEFASVTTCERPRAGYHVTGRTIDVTPGDRIVISKAVLWLGAAAIFYLPRVVIPLRTVTDERQKPQFFPEIGYNAYQGFYVKARLGFGHDQYYYGYYRIEFYTKQGISLGYSGTIAQRNGKRVTSIDVLRVQDRRVQAVTYNANLQDTENFSQTLRGQLGFTYDSNFGPLVNLPPNTNANVQVVHTGALESQSYTYTRQATGSQASSDSYGFSDTRSFSPTLQNSFTANDSRSQTSYGGFFSQNTSGHVTDLLHWASRAVDYQLTYDKNFSQQPYGINKEPELQIRPNLFVPHFLFPIAPSLTLGEYSEPQTPETTQRADLGVNMGPLLLKILGSDFSANVDVHQYAYGTGDLKASINQQMQLTTPVGTHFTNNVSYSEQNFNGPGSVPFSTLDVQNSQNVKNAYDIMRFFNADNYNFTLSFSTAFNGIAQPVSYQLAMRPSTRSFVQLTGAYVPGPSLGFTSTNVQFSTPFGRGAWLQFLGDVDWKNKARIENKSIYYSRTIGDCYQIQLQFNQNSRALNVQVNLLAFPTEGIGFNLNTTGSIIPSSFNGLGYP